MAAEAPETNPRPGRLGPLLKQLGEQRDGFLVGGAVLYGLGYLAWSVQAWRNGLGPLPALDFQYLISGLAPAAALGIFWAAVRYFPILRIRLRELMETRRWVSTSVNGFALVFGVLGVGLGVALERKWIGVKVVPPWAGWCIGILWFLFFYLISLIRRPKKQSNWFDTFYDWYNRILIPLGFAFICLTGYFEIYPSIPQELGGPAPRCARVHLIRSEVDSDSLQALGSEATGDSTVMRTLPLRVYFSGNEFLLVRPPAKQDPTGNTAKKRWTARDETLYELRNDAIRVIEWCGDGEQAAPGPVNGN